MFGTFGSIIFETLTAPQELALKQETEFAEHGRVGLKPRLQRTGEKLDEVTMQMHFHASFCNPDEQIAALNKMRKAARAEALVLGSGVVLGTFVIVSINKTVATAFSDGTTMQCTVDLLLREYVTTSTIQDKKKAAVASAFAVNADAPLPSVPTRSLAGNPAALIMANIQDAQLAAAQSTTAVEKAQSNPDYFAQASGAISRATEAVYSSINKAEAVLSTSEALQAQALALPGAFDNAKNAALALASLMPITSIEDARLANAEMLSGMRSVRKASAPVATVSSFRGFM